MKLSLADRRLLDALQIDSTRSQIELADLGLELSGLDEISDCAIVVSPFIVGPAAVVVGGNVVRLLFDGSGKMLKVLRGSKKSDELRAEFTSHLNASR